VIAKTDRASVAYKYDGGLKGLPIQAASRVSRRDLAGRWQDQRFGGSINKDSAVVWSSNRLIAAELTGGSIAAFPPPHSFVGARESNQVLGDNYYRKVSDTAFAFGVRQAEKEEDPEFLHNFALTRARPGTWQQMPVFLYVSQEPAAAALAAALAFTHGDTFKPIDRSSRRRICRRSGSSSSASPSTPPARNGSASRRGSWPPTARSFSRSGSSPRRRRPVRRSPTTPRVGFRGPALNEFGWSPASCASESGGA
jgi:hypothetical protein